MKKYMLIQSSILYSELAPLTCDVTCSKLYRCRENVVVKKLSVEQTIKVSHLVTFLRSFQVLIPCSYKNVLKSLQN